MKEHKYIKRKNQYYGGLIFIIASLILIFFYINTRPVKTEYKLYISHTKSGRPVVYLQDEITGKVEMVNPRNVKYLEELKRKYDVVLKE
jgi:uncharacterized integral membrane protein